MAGASGPLRRRRDEESDNLLHMPGVETPGHGPSEELAQARVRGFARILTVLSWTAAGAIASFGALMTALAIMTMLNGGRVPVGSGEAEVSGFIHGLILLYASGLGIALTIAVVALALAGAYWLIPRMRYRNK